MLNTFCIRFFFQLFHRCLSFIWPRHGIKMKKKTLQFFGVVEKISHETMYSLKWSNYGNNIRKWNTSYRSFVEKQQQCRVCFVLNKPKKEGIKCVSVSIIVIIAKDPNDATIFVLAVANDLHVDRNKFVFIFAYFFLLNKHVGSKNRFNFRYLFK